MILYKLNNVQWNPHFNFYGIVDHQELLNLTSNDVRIGDIIYQKDINNLFIVSNIDEFGKITFTRLYKDIDLNYSDIKNDDFNVDLTDIYKQVYHSNKIDFIDDKEFSID